MTIDVSKIDEIISEHEKMLQTFELMRKELEAKFQAVFHEMTAKFWECNPNIYAIAWNQYTPYFNDGDTCTFRRGEIYIMTKPAYDAYVENKGYNEEYHILERDYDTDKNNDYKTTTWKLADVPDVEDLGITLEEAIQAQKMTKILEKIPDIVYLDIFGDHVEVTLTKDETWVDEYEHD